MKTSNKIVPIMVCASVLLMTGCVKLWRKNLDIKTYMMEVQREAATMKVPLGERLWIEPVTVLPPGNIRSLIVRKSEVEFAESYYSELIIHPSENFRNAFYVWLSDSGVFGTVSIGDRNNMTHRLSVTVMDFHGDEVNMKVVLRIKVTLFDENTKAMRLLLSKNYLQEVPLSEMATEALILAYNTALDDILAACEQDVIQALR